MDDPIRHHTLNSTYGDTSGAEFVAKLKKLDFGVSGYLKLEYRFTNVRGNIWVFDRRIEQSDKSGEGLMTETQWGEVMFQ
jgi:hypothetical protein